MLQTVDRLSDKLLAMFVPKVEASAEPCTCVGFGKTQSNCFCNTGAGCFGDWIKKTWQCNNCQWVLTEGCHNTHVGCARC